MNNEDYQAAAEGRLGADRMALGLSIIPDKQRGDMDVVAALRAENERLKERLDFTYCAYCGEKFPADAPSGVECISQHIKTCQKHPMRQLESENERLRSGRLSDPLLEATVGPLRAENERLQKLIEDFGVDAQSIWYRAVEALRASPVPAVKYPCSKCGKESGGWRDALTKAYLCDECDRMREKTVPQDDEKETL